nr:FAD-dependent oxidoreductase [Actinomycetota bacterium]
VLGGGMAGLAAAHELAERGFEVTVYERKALGGKARSIPVAGTAAGGRRPLPGEHGFRFFPGFYHHVPDSMRRIPFQGNTNGVWDNLVDTSDTRSPRTNGRPDGHLFGAFPHYREAFTPDGLRRILVEELVKRQGIQPLEAEFFVNRLMVFLTSSEERRFGQWEHTSWWDFVRAEERSEEYKRILARGLTRTVVAAKEHVASTRTIGHMGEAFLMNIMQRGNDGELDRVLNAPTNEAWIDPWVAHLKKLGVRFRVGHAITRLDVGRGRVLSARARDARGRTRLVEADWFVSAMPVERARTLLNRDLLAIDPSLEGMRRLFVDWMNGIQFYLRRRVDLVHGHLTFPDSQWALTALTQAQFWSRNDFARDYGDGAAVDCLSVDVSDWDTPGMLYGKPAKNCTREEIAREVWMQLKAHLEDTGESVLPDDILHSWFLDPAIAWDTRKGRNRNDEPLLVNTIGSWEQRPRARTKVPNLFLAGDYVQTDVDLATMEGANESGRAAVNALLDAAGSRAEPVTMYKLYDPPEFEPAKRLDAELYKAGLPHALDRP